MLDSGGTSRFERLDATLGRHSLAPGCVTYQDDVKISGPAIHQAQQTCFDTAATDEHGADLACIRWQFLQAGETESRFRVLTCKVLNPKPSAGFGKSRRLVKNP